MDYVWNMKYLKSVSRLNAFIPRASPEPLGIGLPKTSWVKLNRLRTGVRRFHSSNHTTTNTKTTGENLRVSFTSDTRQHSELQIWIRKASAAMRQLHHFTKCASIIQLFDLQNQIFIVLAVLRRVVYQWVGHLRDLT